MKKIIGIIFFLLLLSSCGTKTINENIGNIPKEKRVKTMVAPNFKDIYKKIRKLETINLSNIEISTINEYLDSIYLNKIVYTAIKNKNIKECEKLEEKIKDSCIMLYSVNTNNLDTCKNIKTNTGNIIDCENSIIKINSEKKLDTNICNKLNTSNFSKKEANNFIESCKNDIYIEKARKALDEKKCNKIINKNTKGICLDIIRREKQHKLNAK